MNIFKKLRYMVKGPVSCQKVSDFLADYLDDALDPKLKKRFDLHLAICPNCTIYLDQYKQTISWVQESEEPVAIPPLLANHTLAFLKEHLDD